jgi:hypothetical protein
VVTVQLPSIGTATGFGAPELVAPKVVIPKTAVEDGSRGSRRPGPERSSELRENVRARVQEVMRMAEPARMKRTIAPKSQA